MSPAPGLSLDGLLRQRCKWLEGTGPMADIAVSARIRLARNLEGVPFPRRATPEQLKDVESRVVGALARGAETRAMPILSLEDLSQRDRQFLVERHLLSQDHAAAQLGRVVAIEPHEQVSIMVNEEDHVRIQALESGLQLREAWSRATRLDDELSGLLPIAFSSTWGYLTYCPTNTGTALRASVMLHLPALVFQRRAEKVLQGVTQLGLTVRGLYGEGTDVRSVFFQISNQVALGKSEEELIEHVERIARQVVEHERSARTALMKQARPRIEDSVWRAYGILSHARMLASTEATDLLSAVRLGIELGMVTQVPAAAVNELLILVQPAHTQRLFGVEMSASMRDVKRAELVRERLAGGPLPGKPPRKRRPPLPPAPSGGGISV